MTWPTWWKAWLLASASSSAWSFWCAWCGVCVAATCATARATGRGRRNGWGARCPRPLPVPPISGPEPPPRAVREHVRHARPNSVLSGTPVSRLLAGPPATLTAQHLAGGQPRLSRLSPLHRFLLSVSGGTLSGLWIRACRSGWCTWDQRATVTGHKAWPLFG